MKKSSGRVQSSFKSQKMGKRKAGSILDFFKKADASSSILFKEEMGSSTGKKATTNSNEATRSTNQETASSAHKKDDENIAQILKEFNDPSFISTNSFAPMWENVNEGCILEKQSEAFRRLYGEKEAEETVCPICGMDLSTLSISVDVHVNDCLDGKTSMKQVTSDTVEESTTVQVRKKMTSSTSIVLRNKKQRTVPRYKLMPFNIPFAVDAFKYGKIDGVEAYFLSHFHSDHYGGLSSSWCHGPIYCSSVTGRLLENILHVDKKYIKCLSENEPHNVYGVTVFVIPANHCPGSSIFLFETIHSEGTKRVLHTGDFRACRAHIEHPLLRDKHIHRLYLDTTYLDPKYMLPAQSEVVNACAEKCRLLQEADASRLLVVVSTYSIGKEKVAVAIAKALKTLIYVDDRKRKILDQLEDEELQQLLTDDPNTASVHMATMMQTHPEALSDYLNKRRPTFDRIVSFRVTGWEYRPKGKKLSVVSNLNSILTSPPAPFGPRDLRMARGSSPSCVSFLAPYSEHSSFYDLSVFCSALDVDVIIPTVNLYDQASRRRMNVWIGRWNGRRKKHGVLSIDDLKW
ncbi:DNA 5' exonuclease [Schizosaccharomyces japonicus yFS275]|uniref:DNA 5' exonuclease n=1 Tax=Schizosaccharomyces japonicus (strain yFS275 / FY16936) TaxID=402676 RepID=B6K2T7_SCHJY|nr:DNA 5' exonuclease [Schizosaccharomyces japonicus yFS275]EEB08577.1 DNA 5' exonuclease [Schizosaccharomyces japonicus yFS275]